MYRSLLVRLEEHKSSLAANADSRTSLSHISSAVSSKICRLNAASEPSLIADVPGFLALARNELTNDLKEINQKAQVSLQKKQIASYKKEYESQLLPRIKEANHFIKMLGEEIRETNERLDDHIKNLMQEIEGLKKSKQAEQKTLLQKQDELRRAMPLKMLFNVLSVGTKALGFLGTAGGMAGGLLDAGLGIAQGFSPSSTEQDKLNAIPEGVHDMVDLVHQSIDTSPDIPSQPGVIEERLKAQGLYFNQMTGEWAAFKVNYERITNRQVKEDILNDLEKEVSHNKSSGEKLKKILEKAQVAVSVAQAGIEIYNSYRSDQSQMDELSRAIEANREELKKLSNYQEKVTKEFTPYVEKVKNTVQDFQGNLKDKSSVCLDVQKWNVRRYLMDVQHAVQKLTKGFEIADEFKLSLGKMEGALETVIQLYERLQNFQDQMIFARYMADLTTSTLPTSPEEDTALQLATSKLENVIFYNIIMEQHAKVINAVKQWTFPFSSFFMEDLEVLEGSLPMDDIVKQAAKNLERLDKKVKEFGVTIHPTIYRAIKQSEFRREYQASRPFFTWNYNMYSTEIENLLQGKEVILKAELPINALPALKFDEIEVELSHKNPEKNSNLQQILKNYDVILTHWGNSDYKYGDNIYKISTGKFSIEYSFERYPNTHNPIRKNEIYAGLQRGKPVLSPYAFWSIHIKPSDLLILPEKKLYETFIYKTFNTSLSQINLHLVGHGWYVDEERM